MSLKDDVHSEEVDNTKLGLARREIRTLKSLTIRQQEELEDLEKQIYLLTKLDNTTLTPPKWVNPARTKKHAGIPSLLVSDTHFDEVVQPEEIAFLNAYNREIAEMRLRATFDNAVKFAQNYVNGITYDGFVLFLGGDMVTGTLHDLAETNEAHLPDTVLHWSEQLAAGIEMLADTFGRVHVAGVVGNHGRNTIKPRTKGRVRDNNDWLIYRLVARDFRKDNRVTFQIPESADCIVPIYDTKFLFTHGDQFRGGSGVAGILNPVMRGDAKKRKVHMETDRPYDYMIMGHWHSYLCARKIIVNGTNKGYDEYSFLNSFDFEVPQQAFWINTAEHGPILHAPIFTQDRKAEGW